jgi:hypothetical protein
MANFTNHFNFITITDERVSLAQDIYIVTYPHLQAARKLWYRKQDILYESNNFS